MGAEGCDDAGGFLDSLDAVDGFLHARIKILHADGNAGQAIARERADARLIKAARVDLDSKLAVGADA